jgi:external thioesterase TEII
MKKNIFHQLKTSEGGRQLICFPYLGGYANSFFELTSILGEDLDVWAANPPGHGVCNLEPMQDIKILLDLYCEELLSILKPDSVFFGHSMGGIVAYFLAQRILNSDEFTTKSITLILSACNTPSDFKTKQYSKLSNDDLIEHLISYDGISDELINEKSLLEYFVPIFRADFNVLETSATLDYKPLDIPIYFLWGENDKIVPFDSIIHWSKYFVNELTIIPIENGTHMFIQDKVNAVAEHLVEIMGVREEKC